MRVQFLSFLTVIILSVTSQSCSVANRIQLKAALPTHQRLMEILVPSEKLAEDAELSRLYIEAGKEIQATVENLPALQTGLAALRLDWKLMTGKPAESMDHLISLLNSPVTQIRKATRLIYSFYLFSIYVSDFGKKVSGTDTHLPTQIKPETLDAVIEEFQKLSSTFDSSALVWDSEHQELRHRDGEWDAVVVGSGLGGSVVASELSRMGRRVLLVERGGFPVPGAILPQNEAGFLDNSGFRTTDDGGIIIKNANTVGGGSSVNVDLAFAPTLATVHERISKWRQESRISSELFSDSALASSYSWVTGIIGTRSLSESEINRNNHILWDGSNLMGWPPQLYSLNRTPARGDVDGQKLSTVQSLILPRLSTANSPLLLIPNTEVVRLGWSAEGKKFHVDEVVLRKVPAWNKKGVLSDLHGLKIPDEQEFKVKAKKVILAAGALGTPTILLKSELQSLLPGIGKGFVLHPSIPIVGEFSDIIDNEKGLTASVYNDTFALTAGHGYILEAMSAGPEYGALMSHGTSTMIFETVQKYRYMGGFGVMLVDDADSENYIEIDSDGQPVIHYKLSDDGKARLKRGLEKSIRIIFAAGAKRIYLPSSEWHGVRDKEAYFDSEAEAIEGIASLEFRNASTILTSAHMQGSCKMGPDPETAVVDWNGKVHGADNLYIADGSIFPASVGANPMQAIYTFVKILVDEWNRKF